MVKHFAANMLTLLILAAVGVAALMLWGRSQYDNPGPLAEAICLKVERGSDMSRVADDLVDRGAVSNAFVFRTGARYENKTQQLKAGSFLVQSDASMAQIVDAVTKGGANTCGSEVIVNVGINAMRMRVRGLNPATGDLEELASINPREEGVELPPSYIEAREDSDTRYRISFAEGVTNWQIENALLSLDFLDGDIVDMPREGGLSPNSYEVRLGGARQDLIDQMRAAQSEILDAAWFDRDVETPLVDRQEALILASIIEKETAQADERPLVASVFVNRLNKGIRLQTDPTVIYGITKGEGILGRGLRRSELDRATPYNTYQIDGLPPTPIANPGKAAIEAALKPAESDFIFFVADGTGGHAFAKTLQEHNRNVAAWRKIERERAEAAKASDQN